VAEALNVARWIERSAVNGPGERFVLWLQGCPLRCPGCWNPDTWDFTPRRRMEPEELVEVVEGVTGIEGVTLTGGEPFSQAGALVPIVRRLRESGLSVMIFTGFELDELRSPPQLELLGLTDVLVSGRYIEAERDETLTWRGSRSQRVSFLTERYGEDAMDQAAGMRLEFHLTGAEASVTGFPGSWWLRPTTAGEPMADNLAHHQLEGGS